jgi:hypothetical protein
MRELPAQLASLVALPNWVLWRWELTENKKTGEMGWTKVPYQVQTKFKASTNKSSTWATHAQAAAAPEQALATEAKYLQAVDPADAALHTRGGIGFVLTNTEIVAFDLDKCRNPDTGELKPWAQQLLEKSNSYAEVTPSKTGIRIIGTGSGAEIHRKLQVADGMSCEFFRRATRYITMTGDQLNDLGLSNLDGVMDAALAELEATKPQPKKPSAEQPGDNDEDPLSLIIRKGEHGKWGGDRSRAEIYVICEMLRRGHDRRAILAVLTDRANGISEKVLEQPNPHEYAERQVDHGVQLVTLATDKNCKPYPSQSNIRVAMLKLGVSVSYNTFSDQTMISGLSDFGPTLDDAGMIRLRLLIDQRFKLLVSKDMLHDVVTDTARLRAFHPVRDYLDLEALLAAGAGSQAPLDGVGSPLKRDRNGINAFWAANQPRQRSGQWLQGDLVQAWP